MNVARWKIYPKMRLRRSTLASTISKSRKGMTQCEPCCRERRFRRLTIGRRSIQKERSLPRKIGTSAAPKIKTAAGGTALIIIGLLALYQGPKNIFCRQNEDHTRDKPEHGIKSWPFLPRKICVLMDERFDKQEYDQRREKEAEKPSDILRLIEEMLVFHVKTSFARFIPPAAPSMGKQKDGRQIENTSCKKNCKYGPVSRDRFMGQFHFFLMHGSSS